MNIDRIYFKQHRFFKNAYLERRMKRKSIDTVALASICAPHMSMDSMRTRFDWDQEIKKIAERIQEWKR